VNDSQTDFSNASIVVKNLEKNYTPMCSYPIPNSVNKLNFCLNKGECFALLGLNGAGKTTTF